MAILSALLLLPASLQAQPSPALTATVTRTTTILHLGHHRVALERDNTVDRSTPPPTLKLIAELPGKALLLTDTYPSRPMGLFRCQAGEEQFLRLITLLPRPTETFHLKLASCRNTLELAGDGLAWSSTDHTLTVHWLTPPASRNLHVNQNGRLMPSP